jgi:hypothetical protein
MTRFALAFCLSGALAVGACGDSAEDPDDDGVAAGAGGQEAGGAGTTTATTSSTGQGGEGGEGGGPADVDKAKDCADTFGDGLTAAFARLDGTVLAVVGPTDTQCTLPNDDHLVIQVTMGGEVYRMVVNVDGVFYAETGAPLVGPAWAEGWHTGVALEYDDTLDMHSDAFVYYPMAELVELVTDAIELGAPISVYAESSGGEFASSAHLVHRNNSKPDGAIALDPLSANPRLLLFRFSNQSF